ncbi:MAG: DUF4142 domain-containing protein [Planctomycetaceae bacterium]|nr:DUF4142 domain-containing protein [Planctomycetaceae bacterium]
MKIGTLRNMCAAAVAAALAVPAMAQDAPTAEGGTPQSPNAARGAAGEAGTVRPNARQAQPGATQRPGAPQAGTIAEEQETLQPGTRTANFPPQSDRRAQGRQGQGQLGDAALVRWIGADNEAEIRISEIAQQKAQNEQVKQFAKMMVDEHTKLGEQLQQASQGQGNQGDAANRSTTIQERTTRRNATERNANENENENETDRDAAENRNERNADRDDANAPGQDNAPNARNANRTTTEIQTETRTAGGNRQQQGANNPAVALHEQIKQECVASFTKELQSKNGAEFDKCYLGQQIMAHQGMIDTLKVVDQHASADLKQTLQQAQQATKQHLQKAKELMKQVENERQ